MKKDFKALVLLLIIVAALQPGVSAKENSLKLNDFVSAIDFSRVWNYTKVLSSYESRVPGYPGYYKAVRFIADYFREMGVGYILENFSVTSPVEEKVYIRVIETGEVFEAHALWPNMIVTSNIIYEGKIVYGGKGRLLDFSGRDLEGSIVLLDFNCRWFWTNAFSLGAKAVIFIENRSTLRLDAWLKVFYMPAYFPRIYVDKKVGERLIEYARMGYHVKVHSKVEWREVTATNIVAMIPGTDVILSKEAICIVAHVDSLSPVPAKAPGASEAFNVALVLELARLFLKFKPKRSIVILITGAHGLALAGAREYVSVHFNELGSRIRLVIELDLDWTGSELATQYYGLFYNLLAFVPGYEARYRWVRDRMIEYMDLISEVLGEKIFVYDTLSLTYFFYEPVPCFLDSEVFALTGIPAFTLRTFYSIRPWLYTPYDTLEHAERDFAEKQAKVALSIIYCFTQDPEKMPSSVPTTRGVGYGFSYIKGRVYRYNRTKGWFEPVSAIVALPMWPYHIGVLTDSNGTFIVKGVRYSGYYWLLGFRLSEEGTIEAANEYGGLGPVLPMLFGVSVYKTISEVNIRITDCGSFVIINAYDPRFFIPGYLSFSVLNATYHTALISWGPQYWYWYSQVLVLPAGTKIEVVMKRGLDVVAVINNASLENPLGEGYSIKKGKQILLKNFPLVAASTLYAILDYRIKTLRVYSYRVLDYHKEAGILINESRRLLRDKKYGVAYASMLRAWAMEAHAYNSFQFLLGDIGFALIIIVVLLFIASMRLKLLFRKAPNIVAFSCFTLSLLVVSLCHPSVRACSLSLFIVPSAGVLLVVIIVVISLLKTFLSQIMKIRRKPPRVFSRRVFAEILLLSLATSVSFFMTGSLTYVTHISEAMLGSKGSYSGIMIRTFPWSVLCEAEYDVIRSEVKALGGYSSMRVWAYPHYGEVRVSNMTILKAFLGLGLEEVKISNIEKAIVKGGWFSSEFARECIVSSFLAKTLNISIGDEVVLYGLRLKVVGIFNESMLSVFKDLDGELITPRDIMIPRSEEIPVHIAPKYVVIVPDELAREMDGNIYSIAISFNNSKLLIEYARRLAYIFDGVYVYLSVDGERYIVAAHHALGFKIVNRFFLMLVLFFSSTILIVASVEKEFTTSDALQASFIGGIIGYVAHLALAEAGLCEPSVITLAPIVSCLMGFIPVSLSTTFSRKLRELREAAIEAVPVEYRIKIEAPLPRALDLIEEVVKEALTEEHGYLIKRRRRTGEYLALLVQILPRELFLFYKIVFKPITVNGETYIVLEITGKGLGAKKIRRRIVPDIVELIENKLREKEGEKLEE